MTVSTSAPPVPTPKRSKRRWLILGAFLVLLFATPYAYLTIVGTMRDRELEQIYAELDAEDPHWRWPDLIKQLPPAPPDQRNAMVQVQKVIGIMKSTPFGMGPLAGKKIGPNNARLTDADERRLRAALAALAPTTLEEARKLKDMPEGSVTFDPKVRPLDVNLDFINILNVTRVLEHDAILRTQEREADKSADASLAIVHSAHSIGEAPHLMAQLVRVAVQMQAVNAMERMLGHAELDEERLERLQKALWIEANHNGPFHAMRGERAFIDDAYQSIRSGDSAGKKIINEVARQRGKFYFLFPGFLLRGYPEHLRLQNAIVRATTMTDNSQAEALEALQVTKPDILNPLNNSVIFMQSNLVQFRSDHSRVRCAVAAIAAERYRLKYEHWPTEMNDLVKDGLLKAPVTDPFDGQPLRFQRSDTKLVVYSIGGDKTDNRGGKGDTTFELWLPTFRATPPPAMVEDAPKM